MTTCGPAGDLLVSSDSMPSKLTIDWGQLRLGPELTSSHRVICELACLGGVRSLPGTRLAFPKLTTGRR